MLCLEPTGVERVHEALEANDWSGNELGGADDGFLSDGSSDAQEDVSSKNDRRPVKGQDGLKLEADEMEKEMFGLHQALYASDASAENEQEMEVEDLEKALRKLQIIKGIFIHILGDLSMLQTPFKWNVTQNTNGGVAFL